MSLLRGPGPQKPDPEPLELADAHVVLLGTLLWLLALVVLAVLLAVGVDVHGWWLVMCGCGVVLGLAGLRYVARRSAALRRR